MWGQIGGDSENEAPENGPRLPCAPDRGGAHQSQSIPEGEELVKGKSPDPLFRVSMMAKVEKMGSWNVEDAPRPNIWGGSHTLEPVTGCLKVIPNVLLPSVSPVQWLSRVRFFATP